jgi:regulator of protease activity HflC (stomatin/prohibitin superfamily)
MGLFIFMVIVALIGVIAMIVSKRIKTPEPVEGDRFTPSNKNEVAYAGTVKRVVFYAGLGLATLAMIVVGLSSYTIVPARNLGVPISLGQPGDVVNNGFHVIPPWASVETFDATVQIVTVESQTVRLGNGGTAVVNASIQWQIDPAKNNFLALYRQYRTFGAIHDKAIQRNFGDVLNQVFENFDPLATIDANGQVAVQMADLEARVLAKMTAIGITGIILRNAVIYPPKYSDKVEEQIDNIIAASAATRIAEQQKKTAQLIADANNIVAKGDLTPGVLYQNCLNLVLKMGANMPPAFSCGIPGANVVIATAK